MSKMISSKKVVSSGKKRLFFDVLCHNLHTSLSNLHTFFEVLYSGDVAICSGIVRNYNTTIPISPIGVNIYIFTHSVWCNIILLLYI